MQNPVSASRRSDAEEAQASPDWPMWLVAMHEELTSLGSEYVFSAADLPRGRKAIAGFFRTNFYGHIELYKAIMWLRVSHNRLG
jgi:hypothetical protein